MSIIYGLVDPNAPDEIRYVGQTVNPKMRLERHKQDARNERGRRGGRKTDCAQWIESLNIDPEMIILEENVSNLNGAEANHIWRLKKEGHRLVNACKPPKSGIEKIDWWKWLGDDEVKKEEEKQKARMRKRKRAVSPQTWLNEKQALSRICLKKELKRIEKSRSIPYENRERIIEEITDEIERK